MTFVDFCSLHGVRKGEVYTLFEYWCLLRVRDMRKVLSAARRAAK